MKVSLIAVTNSEWLNQWHMKSNMENHLWLPGNRWVTSVAIHIHMYVNRQCITHLSVKMLQRNFNRTGYEINKEDEWDIIIHYSSVLFKRDQFAIISTINLFIYYFFILTSWVTSVAINIHFLKQTYFFTKEIFFYEIRGKSFNMINVNGSL
jgi:hypothetical protein